MTKKKVLYKPDIRGTLRQLKTGDSVFFEARETKIGSVRNTAAWLGDGFSVNEVGNLIKVTKL